MQGTIADVIGSARITETDPSGNPDLMGMVAIMQCEYDSSEKAFVFLVSPIVPYYHYGAGHVPGELFTYGQAELLFKVKTPEQQEAELAAQEEIMAQAQREALLNPMFQNAMANGGMNRVQRRGR